MGRITIVKKRTKTFDRFESDRYHRMDVSISLNSREAGENQGVSIVESEESSEVI
jgi:ribosomal protein L32E